jgi:hypothetical protein
MPANRITTSSASRRRLARSSSLSIGGRSRAARRIRPELWAAPADDGRRMIGGGILGMIERSLNAEGHYPPKPEIDRMFRAFVDHYGAHIANSFASG